MSGERISYNFAVLRVVPHVYTGTFVNVGVILHARTTQYLGMRVLRDLESLRAAGCDVDLELLVRYLDSCEAVCRGDESAGPVALLPPSERFHWLTAPRSDVIQASPVHAGLTSDPEAEVTRLYAAYVAPLPRAPEP